MQGIAGAADFFRHWLQTIPAEIGIRLTLIDPGSAGGGSDQISFVCEGAPAFSLQSIHWDYERYTWHTNRDTFDKLVFDDLRTNATLVAMLAYLAAEEPQRLPWNPQAASASGSIPASKKIACPTVARSWEQRRQ